MLRSNPQNQAYANRTVAEGMGSLSSIMNPSASQNASYQLERKRFLEGNAQAELNKAMSSLATSDVGKRLISDIFGYKESDGVDVSPLVSRMAFDPNFQQSTAGVQNLSTGKQKQNAYEIMTAPETLPGLPGPDDTQRIAATTAYTNKYMPANTALTGGMRESMLETADELARYQIDQEQITGRQQAPFNIPLDSRAVMPDGSTVDGMQSPVDPPKPLIIPQDSDAVIQNADGSTTRVQGPRSTPKKQVITLNEGQTATILNEDGTTKTIQGPSAVQDPVTLTLDPGQKGIIRNADGTTQTFDGRDPQAEAVTATVGTGQKLYIKMPDGTETVVDGPAANQEPTVTVLGPGERATLTNAEGQVIQTIEGPALPKTLTKLIVGPDEVGTLVTDDGTQVVTVEGQKSPAKPVTIKAGLDEVVKLISGDKEITLNGPRTPEQGIQVKAGVNETVAVYKDGKEVYRLTGMSEKEQLLSVSAKTGETVFIYDKAGQLLNSFKGQDAKPEPYSVSIPEGGSAHIRYADGTERTILGQPKQRKLSDNIVVLGPDKTAFAPTAEGDLELVASTVQAVGPEYVTKERDEDLIRKNPDGTVELAMSGRLESVLGPNQIKSSLDESDNQTSTIANRLPKVQPLKQNVEKEEKKVKPPKTLGAQKDFNMDWVDRTLAFSEDVMKQLPAEVMENLKAETAEIFEENYRNPDDPEAYRKSFNAAFDEVFGKGNPVRIDPPGIGDVTVPAKIFSNLKAGQEYAVKNNATAKQIRSLRSRHADRLEKYGYDRSQIKIILDKIYKG